MEAMQRQDTDDAIEFSHAESLGFFAAVQAAIDEKGLQDVTQDDIIRHSGVPRTTLYRRYGGRDALLAKFLRYRFADDIAACGQLATSPAPFAERMENLIVYSIMAAHRHGWLQRELDRGLSTATIELLASAMQNASSQTLVPLLARARAEGLCRCPAPFDELQRWLLVQIFELSHRRYDTDEEAHRIVRTYVLPVLALAPTSPSIEEKIDVLYHHLMAAFPPSKSPD